MKKSDPGGTYLEATEPRLNGNESLGEEAIESSPAAGSPVAVA
jgi:hypothetical protein